MLTPTQFIGRIALVVGLLVGGYLYFSDTSQKSQPDASANASAQGQLVSLSRSPVSAHEAPEKIHATKPIEQIRVGDRVLAHNPEVSDEERASWAEPDWNTCYHLHLVLPKSDGSKLKIEMLRSEQWVRNQLGYTLAPKSPAWHPPMALILEGDSDEADNAAVADADVQSEAPEEGAYRFVLSPVRPLLRDLLLTKARYAIDDSIDLIALTVELDLPEMGATGTAVITDIHPCAAIASGNGQVVTATFSHPPSNEVLNVIFEGEAQPVGVTDNHLFWSVNRQQFLPIGKMEIGEQVQTFHGETKRIERKLARPGPEIVYNLEVCGEHVYFVGEQGLLAHNMYDVNGNVVYRDDLDGLFPAPRRAVIDNDVLAAAWIATRRQAAGLSINSQQTHALSLVNSKKYHWILDPNGVNEFLAIPHGGASRGRFLRSLEGQGQLSVLNNSAAGNIASSASFQNQKVLLSRIAEEIKPGFGMRPNRSTRRHTNFGDQIHSTFASELGVDFVTFDKKFIHTANQTYRTGIPRLGIPGVNLRVVHASSLVP